MTPHDIWIDPVWSKVIGAFIIAAITGISRLFGWPKRLWVPKLRKTHAYASDQATTGATYPLKYYLELVNDSRKCIEVRVSEYKPSAVTLQKFVPSTLQLFLEGTWLPTPHSIEAVGLLPNQRCRAWIGVDANKHKKEDLERLEGKIGTLILAVNGKKVPFEL